MISTLLNEVTEDEDKQRKESVISGVAAAAYTGKRLIQGLYSTPILNFVPLIGGSDTVCGLRVLRAVRLLTRIRRLYRLLDRSSSLC